MTDHYVAPPESDSDHDDLERRARRYLLDEQADLLAAIQAAAAAVAEDWAGSSTTCRSRAVGRLAAALDDRHLRDSLADCLRELASAIGLRAAARPVAAPPYVIITGLGVVLRLPSDGRRLVVTVQTFEIQGTPPRYRLLQVPPEESLRVRLRRSP